MFTTLSLLGFKNEIINIKQRKQNVRDLYMDEYKIYDYLSGVMNDKSK